MVGLTHTDLATEEDKYYQIDRWAKLFKATTWEEMKQMAEGNEYLTQVTQALYEYNSDEIIRQQCRAREEYYRYQRTIEKANALEKIQTQEDALKEKDAEILRLKALLDKKDD